MNTLSAATSKLRNTQQIAALLAVVVFGVATFGNVPIASAAGVYATSVVANSPYADVWGHSPSNVLGAPDGVWEDFDNSGNQPGFVTVGLGSEAIDGPGDDLLLHLIDFSTTTTAGAPEDETFTLMGSADGSTYVPLIPTSRTPVGPAVWKLEAFGYDIAGRLPVVRFVKVVNLKVTSAHIYEGPDIDAFEVIQRAAVTTPTPTPVPTATPTPAATPTQAPEATPTPKPETSKGLRILKTDSREITRPGHTLTYVITVKNTGETDMQDIVITDTVPNKLTVTSIADGGTRSGNTVTWRGISLDAGESKTFEISAKVHEAAGNNHVLVNKVKACSNDHDVCESTSDSTRVERLPQVAAYVAPKPVPVTARTGAMSLMASLTSLLGGAGGITYLVRSKK